MKTLLTLTFLLVAFSYASGQEREVSARAADVPSPPARNKLPPSIRTDLRRAYSEVVHRSCQTVQKLKAIGIFSRISQQRENIGKRKEFYSGETVLVTRAYVLPGFYRLQPNDQEFSLTAVALCTQDIVSGNGNVDSFQINDNKTGKVMGWFDFIVGLTWAETRPTGSTP